MSEEHDKAIAEFLANGGKIQYGAYRESGRVEGAVPIGPWGARKAGRPSAASKEELPPADVEEDDE